MKNWGIGLISIGFIFFFSSLENLSKGEKSLVFPATLMISSGVWLTKKGEKEFDFLKECAEIALAQNREKGYVDAYALSKRFQVKEVVIRQMIGKAQKELFIPKDLIIK